MTIRVVCHNGHALKINDNLAGKSGRCPVCKVQVQVPAIEPAAMSEDAIMDILGPQGKASQPAPRRETADPETTRHAMPARDPSLVKSCSKCKREIATEVHVCPHCRTYVGGHR